MQDLNLPVFDYKVKEQDGKPFIWDEIRKKYLLITPEEWVRQHFIHFLIARKYPKSLISVEGGLKYNQRQKRTDILVLNRMGDPFLLVECKAPEVKVNQKTLEQAIYYNQVIRAPYIALTNGLQHFFCHIDFKNQKASPLADLPNYET